MKAVRAFCVRYTDLKSGQSIKRDAYQGIARNKHSKFIVKGMQQFLAVRIFGKSITALSIA
jgi:hypothetical protein